MPVIYPSTVEYERFGKAFLKGMVDWVSAEYRPEEVYTEAELREWAQDNGYFAESELAQWAEEHGYVEEGAEA